MLQILKAQTNSETNDTNQHQNPKKKKKTLNSQNHHHSTQIHKTETDSPSQIAPNSLERKEKKKRN